MSVLMAVVLLLMMGLISIMPGFSMLWFLLCSSNMAAPPSLNLLSEVYIINSLVGWSSTTFIFLMLVSFFSCCYSIYLYAFTQHGSIYDGLHSFSSSNLREYILVLFHWLPLNLLILNFYSFGLFF